VKKPAEPISKRKGMKLELYVKNVATDSIIGLKVGGVMNAKIAEAEHH